MKEKTDWNSIGQCHANISVIFLTEQKVIMYYADKNYLNYIRHDISWKKTFFLKLDFHPNMLYSTESQLIAYDLF